MHVAASGPQSFPLPSPVPLQLLVLWLFRAQKYIHSPLGEHRLIYRCRLWSRGFPTELTPLEMDAGEVKANMSETKINWCMSFRGHIYYCTVSPGTLPPILVPLPWRMWPLLVVCSKALHTFHSLPVTSEGQVAPLLLCFDLPPPFLFLLLLQTKLQIKFLWGQNKAVPITADRMCSCSSDHWSGEQNLPNWETIFSFNLILWDHCMNCQLPPSMILILDSFFQITKATSNMPQKSRK